MYVKYESCGDPIIIHIPSQKQWTLRHITFDDNCDESYRNILEIEGCEPIILQESKMYCANRPDLPDFAVGALLKDVVNTVAERLALNPDQRLIDITGITQTLIGQTYFSLWERRGYIIVDEDGRW